MFDYLNHVNDLYPIRRKEEQKENFRKYVLEEAQKLGYAEANPSADVDGLDTGRKTAISSSIAFSSVVK